MSFVLCENKDGYVSRDQLTWTGYYDYDYEDHDDADDNDDDDEDDNDDDDEDDDGNSHGQDVVVGE